MNFSSATFATKLTHKRVSCRQRRKTKRDYCVTNKVFRETNVFSLVSYVAFGKKSLPTKWNYKYVKQCSPFVTVPKSFFKVQIGNLNILVFIIKFFLKCPFFSVNENQINYKICAYEVQTRLKIDKKNFSNV